MAYVIDLDPCINCGLCRRACPTETIHYFTTRHRTHVIDPAGCIDCDICARLCPVQCISHDDSYVHDPLELGEAKARAKAWARRRYEREQAARRSAESVTRRLSGAAAPAPAPAVPATP